LAVEESTRRGEFPDERFAVVSGDTARWALAALIGLAVVATLVRLWLGSRIVTPWIMIDELIYSDLARSVADEGTFHVRGEPIPWFNFGYAALIAPAWLVTDAQSSAYTLAKTLNVGFGVLALVPVYLWARRLTSPSYAAVAAGLTVLMPSLLYGGTLMSENGFLPAFLVAALAISLSLERPTPVRQGLALAAIALASLIRVQGIILLAALPSAIALAAVLEARVAPSGARLRAASRYLARFWPTVGALLLLLGAYAAVKAAQGQPLSTGLGSYRVVGETRYGVTESAQWFARHLADVALATGMVPVCALLVLLGLAFLRGEPSPAERAFLAAATAASLWIVAQASVFAANFAFRIEERNIFCVFPLLFVALVLWLHRGAPRRPWPLAVVAAAAPAAAVVFALPLRSLLGVQIFSDTFALLPLLRLSQLFSGGVDAVELTLEVAAVLAALAFLFVPARFAALFPLAIAVFFLFSTYAVHGAIRDYAANLAAGTSAGDRSWIDRAVPGGEPVDFLYGGTGNLPVEASTLWQAEFWNTSVDDVYNLGVPQPAGLVEVAATLDPKTGRIQGNVAPDAYAVGAERLAAPGSVVARNGSLVLYRLESPARVGRAIEGVYADGWTGAEAAVTQYATPANRPARLRVRLSRAVWSGPDVPGRVTLRLGRVVVRDGRAAIGDVLETRTWVAHRRRSTSFTLDTPRPPFRVEIEVSPTFSPSRFGGGDTRELGVQAAFRLSR
jgi:hypothetical protein